MKKNKLFFAFMVSVATLGLTQEMQAMNDGENDNGNLLLGYISEESDENDNRNLLGSISEDSDENDNDNLLGSISEKSGENDGGSLPGHISQESDEQKGQEEQATVLREQISDLKDIGEELFIAVQAYDYMQIMEMAQNNKNRISELEIFLSTHPTQALSLLTFAIKSLDTFTELMREPHGNTPVRWEKLRFNSLRIAHLLIKNGAPEERLSPELQNTLRKFDRHYKIKRVHFV